ncbi:hypothetical protein MUA02_05480 [Enterobacteriaceae bacterium H20N1]|uniref:Uncharacterized protein n=1 Tax=Dryocola boscaweniae TaxID=2925397 RepID=A0A9X2W703_9ENTR|nr:hypothetical protein [Dryocola boscaweniae]MCT4701263.1 hypothetical protein [Dryocola boscaweniae]MCT4718502.1 hypothetical protein [Dryocola boscaweniae]
MKKTFLTWWRDFVTEIVGVYLTIATVIVFAMLAATYWPEYAWGSTVCYLLFAIGLYIFLTWKNKNQDK